MDKNTSPQLCQEVQSRAGMKKKLSPQLSQVAQSRAAGEGQGSKTLMQRGGAMMVTRH